MDATPGLRADPCEGSLVREPLFKEDTQRNFPISFGRLASTGGCATRCGFSQLAFTAPLSIFAHDDAPICKKIAGQTLRTIQWRGKQLIPGIRSNSEHHVGRALQAEPHCIDNSWHPKTCTVDHAPMPVVWQISAEVVARTAQGPIDVAQHAEVGTHVLEFRDADDAVAGQMLEGCWTDAGQMLDG